MSIFYLFKSLEPAKRKNLLILFAAAFFFWVSIACLLPILPTYITSLDGTTQQVGQVMGCFAIGLLLARTWMGQIADRKSRKIVVLIGTAVAAIAPIGYLLLASIPGLMVVRAFHGISIAAFTVGYSSLVVDLSPVRQRGELIGYMGLAVPVGLGVGPAIGGLLLELAGYTPIFVISASSGCLSLILATSIENTNTHSIRSQKKEDLSLPNRTFLELIISRSLIIPTVVLSLIGLLFGSLVAFLPLYVRDLNIDFNVGLFYTVVAIASFSIRIFIGKASDGNGRGVFITASLACYLISMALLSIANSPSIFFLIAIAEGAGRGLLVPMMLALISDRSYANERGKVFALCLGGFDVGIALAGPIFGSFVEIIGYQGLFSLAILLAILALFIFITQSSKNIIHSLRFAFGREKDFYLLD